MKSKRHDKIIELVLIKTICTQEDLLKELQNEGYSVTQATVSRDIKELKLSKGIDSQGVYRYITSAVKIPASVDQQLSAIFRESVIQVNYAQNITVIKCRHGMANAACTSLDNLDWSGLVGTIAGDDTIFVLMKTEKDAAEFAKELYKFISE